MVVASNEKWTSVIQSVKSPLGLFALVVLVIEAVLGGLAMKASGPDLTFLVVGLVSTMVIVVLAVALVAWRRPELLLGVQAGAQPPGQPSPTRYDAFISAPMAAFGVDSLAYRKSRTDVLRLMRTMKACGIKDIFYAGEAIPGPRAFEAADLSLSSDLDALRASKLFILIYPDEMVTSALVEVGVALGLHKPVIIHVRHGVKLPYLLEHAGAAVMGGPLVHTYKYANFDDIEQIYEANPRLVEKITASMDPAPAG